MYMLADSSLTPAPFFGNGTENAQDWLAYFIRYVAFKQRDWRYSHDLYVLAWLAGFFAGELINIARSKSNCVE